jgi:hypothetical protein
MPSCENLATAAFSKLDGISRYSNANRRDDDQLVVCLTHARRLRSIYPAQHIWSVVEREFM